MRRLFLRLPRYLIFIIVLAVLVLIFFVSSVTSLQVKSAKEGTKQTISQSITASLKSITNPVSSLKNINNSSSNTSTKNNTSSTNSGVSLLTASGAPIVNMSLASDKKSLSADIPAAGINFDNRLNYYDPAYTISISNPIAKTPDTRFAQKDVTQFTVPTDNVYVDSSQTKLTIEIDVQCRKSWSSNSGVPFFAPIDYPCSSYPAYAKLLTDFYFQQIGLSGATLSNVESCDKTTGLCTISIPITSSNLDKTYKLYYSRISAQDSIIKNATIKSLSISPLFPPATIGLPDYEPDISGMRVDITKTDGTVVNDYDPSTNSVKISRQVKSLVIKNIKVKNLSTIAKAPPAYVAVALKIYSGYDRYSTEADATDEISPGGYYTMPPITLNISEMIDEGYYFGDEGYATIYTRVNLGDEDIPINDESDVNNNTSETTYHFADWSTIIVNLVSDSEFIDSITAKVYKYSSVGGISENEVGSGKFESTKQFTYSPTDEASPNLKYSANAFLGNIKIQEDNQPQPPGYVVVDKPGTYNIDIVPSSSGGLFVIKPNLRNYNAIDEKIADSNMIAESGYVIIKDDWDKEYKVPLINGLAVFELGTTKSIDGSSLFIDSAYDLIGIEATYSFKYNYKINGLIKKTAKWPSTGDEIEDTECLDVASSGRATSSDPIPFYADKDSFQTFDVYFEYEMQTINVGSNSYKVCVYDEKNALSSAWSPSGYITKSITEPAKYFESFSEIDLSSVKKIFLSPFYENAFYDPSTDKLGEDTEFAKDKNFGPSIMAHEMSHSIDYELGLKYSGTDQSYSSLNYNYVKNVNISARGNSGKLKPKTANWVWNNIGSTCSYYPSSVKSRCKVGHSIYENLPSEQFAEQLATVCWVGNKTKFESNLTNIASIWSRLNPAVDVPADLTMQAELTKRVTGNISLYDANDVLSTFMSLSMRAIYNDEKCTGNKPPG